MPAFTDTALIERVKAQALRELHAAAPENLGATLGLRLEEIGGALCSVSGRAPGILINRVIGLGVNRPATQAAVEAIAALYADAEATEFFVHVTPDAQPDDLRDWLQTAGLKKNRGWMKFTRDTSRHRSPGPILKSAASTGNMPVNLPALPPTVLTWPSARSRCSPA